MATTENNGVTFTVNPTWTTEAWPPGNTPETRAYLETVGAAVVRLAKRLAPKETRSLESTIRHSVRTDAAGPHVAVLAGNAMGRTRFVDYAAYVEQGTSIAPVQPFLRPAVDQTIGLRRFRIGPAA